MQPKPMTNAEFAAASKRWYNTWPEDMIAFIFVVFILPIFALPLSMMIASTRYFTQLVLLLGISAHEGMAVMLSMTIPLGIIGAAALYIYAQRQRLQHEQSQRSRDNHFVAVVFTRDDNGSFRPGT